MSNGTSEGTSPGYRYAPSPTGVPLTRRRPSRSQQTTRSPPTPTTRFTNSVSPESISPSVASAPLTAPLTGFSSTAPPGTKESTPSKTTTSPRRGGESSPYASLFTSTRSPLRSRGSMEPLGIWKGCTTKRLNSSTAAATATAWISSPRQETPPPERRSGRRSRAYRAGAPASGSRDAGGEGSAASAPGARSRSVFIAVVSIRGRSLAAPAVPPMTSRAGHPVPRKGGVKRSSPGGRGTRTGPTGRRCAAESGTGVRSGQAGGRGNGNEPPLGERRLIEAEGAVRPGQPQLSRFSLIFAALPRSSRR